MALGLCLSGHPLGSLLGYDWRHFLGLDGVRHLHDLRTAQDRAALEPLPHTPSRLPGHCRWQAVHCWPVRCSLAIGLVAVWRAAVQALRSGYVG